METAPAPTPRQRRFAARRNQILQAAWDLARRDGVAAIPLSELADRVDLTKPSLYTYVGSKAELYDAMFAQGFQQLIDERERLRIDDDPVVALRQGCRHFVEFCVRDPARYQLLFQYSIPGFHPSAESMQVAGRALDYLGRWLAAAGAPDPAALDLMRALLLGLAGEQIANEPGGRRWVQFADDLVDIALGVVKQRAARVARKATPKASRRRD